MSIYPKDRYRSASDLADEVEVWLADEPVRAWREPWSARIGRWSGRHKGVVGASAIVAIICLIALVVVATNLTQRARINRLYQDIDAGLEVQEWTANHLNQMENLVSNLERIYPEEGAKKRQLLHRRFVQSIRRSIAILEERDVHRVVPRIQDAIEVLATRNPIQAELLRQELDDRVRELNAR
jgi:hypothetical protein